jgi:hypothetical protein
MLRELNLCLMKVRGYRASMGRMFARVLGLAVTFAVLSMAPSVAAAAVTGNAAGWRDPASGSFALTVQATPDDVPLESAAASLGGELVDVDPFADGTCEETCPARVILDVDTTEVTDGRRELVVWVTDEDGSSTELLRREITVENTPRPSPCVKKVTGECEVTVDVGSGTITRQPSPPGGPVGGESGPSCASPRLSMRLASKPLRYRRGVPVLAAGRSYRYAGELTCRINGRRKPAPRGTEVQIRNRLRGWTISKPAITLRKAGDVVARLSYRSSRVVIFRVRGAGGEVVRVRIPIRVVHVKKGRR